MLPLVWEACEDPSSIVRHGCGDEQVDLPQSGSYPGVAPPAASLHVVRTEEVFFPGAPFL